MAKQKTLVITHDHCALHQTRKTAPERPMRLAYVMGAVKQLRLENERCAAQLVVQEVQTSEAMLNALSDQCCDLAQKPRRMPALSRTASVGYLEEKIVPAVKAVHTPQYIQRLALTCVQLLDVAGREKSAKARWKAYANKCKSYFSSAINFYLR